MKSILVLDTPKNCGECHMYYNAGFYCEPEHCPLSPLPSKREQHYMLNGEVKSLPDIVQHVYNGMYDQGWNDCIDEIMKGLDK